MDNQVAINFLDQVREILLDDKSWIESTKQPINEAFDMAISALEAQDVSENVGDMVSRKAANRLTTLISNINSTEICRQIELNNLSCWCNIMKNEMKRAMVQFVCGTEED